MKKIRRINVLKPNEIKEIKSEFAKEYKFIDEFFSTLHLPDYQSTNLESEDEAEELNPNVEEDMPPRLKANVKRAQSLDELHKRIRALRDAKYTYKGNIKKKALKKRMRKKKKILEKKSKRNAAKKEALNNSVSNKTNSNAETDPTKAVFNKNRNLVFNKLDFLGETTTVVEPQILKKEGTKQQTMKKLVKKEKYIKRLETTGNKEKISQIKDRDLWQNALKKAEGIKVKDDLPLLKKTIQKKAAQKKASKKKWDNRINMMEKQKSEKQKKRKENITKKNQEKATKRKKKAAKKGRYIPKV